MKYILVAGSGIGGGCACDQAIIKSGDELMKLFLEVDEYGKRC